MCSFAASFPQMQSPPDSLPTVRGRYSYGQILSKHTWFQTGGPCDVLFKPADLEDLSNFLNLINPEIPINILGAGSNILIRDGGLSGVVIKLGGAFSAITIHSDHVYVGGGCLDRTLALTMQQEGIAGFEFLVGIPGTLGGAIKMNAGAYGQEIQDIFISADVLDNKGKLHKLAATDLNFTYRHSDLPQGWIVVGAALKKNFGDKDQIQEKLNHILEQRQNTQPVRGRTGGSTFKNPSQGKAWELIDKAGCRGLSIGDAQVSVLHCNFLLNQGNASAAQLEDLGELVKAKVKESSGVDLEWEIIRLGKHLSEHQEHTNKKD